MKFFHNGACIISSIVDMLPALAKDALSINEILAELGDFAGILDLICDDGICVR